MSELGCLTAPQTILITTRCSAGCRHCPFSDGALPALDLSINEIKRRMLRLGFGLHVLSGGEPFQHPEIDAIVNFLGSEGSTFSASYRIATGGGIELGSWIRPLTALTSSDSNFAGISVGTDIPLGNTPNRAKDVLNKVWTKNLRTLVKSNIPYSLTITVDRSEEEEANAVRKVSEWIPGAQFLYVRVRNPDGTLAERMIRPGL